MKKLHKINDDGLLIFGEDLIINKSFDEEGNVFYDIPDGYTDLEYDGLLHIPKLVDGKWVESKSSEEIEDEKNLNNLIPSKQQLVESDLEIKILTLLIEMEVI